MADTAGHQQKGNNLSTGSNWKKKKTARKKKKKNPITAYFERLKNSQGFDLKDCRYEPSIGEQVYVPKNYGYAIWDRSFCPHCKLKPCITVEYMDTILTKAREEHKKREEAEMEGAKGKKVCPIAVMDRIANYTMKLMKKHFGREYVNRTGIPQCVIEESHTYSLEWYQSD
jgi:vancomycin resistance protein YoaR